MIDAGILEEVLLDIRNWFTYDETQVDSCQISGGALPASVASSLLEGQWYRIQGSLMNDGLHKHPDTELVDETFDGQIDSLAIPKALLNVVEEITEWVELSGEARRKALASPYASESFDGYSYTIKGASGSNSASGGSTVPTGWQAEFGSRLNKWRKL